MDIKITGRVRTVTSAATGRQYVVGDLSIGNLHMAVEPHPYTTNEGYDAAVAATLMDLLTFAENALSSGENYAKVHP